MGAVPVEAEHQIENGSLHFDWLWLHIMVSVCCKTFFDETVLLCGYEHKYKKAEYHHQILLGKLDGHTEKNDI